MTMRDYLAKLSPEAKAEHFRRIVEKAQATKRLKAGRREKREAKKLKEAALVAPREEIIEVLEGAEAGFEVVQRRLLAELDRRTQAEVLKEMDLEDLAALIKTCKENIAQESQMKVMDRGSKMEVVTVLDFGEGTEQ